jgi:AcrR family transcriptional regulator
MSTMVRWEPDSTARLMEAALTLFSERGYDETTVAAIAERAGLTERTFFRHYTDKREVLFAGSGEFAATVTDGVAAAPDGASPLEAVAAGLGAIAGQLDNRRPFARRRAAVVDANPELRERELAKLDALTVDIVDTLRDRGVAGPTAGLTAEAGMAVFRVAFARWASEPGDATLVQGLHDGFAELRAVTAAG